MDSYINVDILKLIFGNLTAKDLVACSQVCKKWNLISNEEKFWCKLLKQECEKINPRLFGMISSINSKSKYMKLFNQKYYSALQPLYSEILYGIKLQHNILCKFFCVFFCLIPLCIFILPFALIFDGKDYWKHKSRTLQVCKCKCCQERIYLLLKK